MKMDIKRTVDSIFKIRNIKTKEDLDKWCGTSGRNKLYRVVEILAEEHWNSIKTPKDSTRYYYQKILEGYKICK